MSSQERIGLVAFFGITFPFCVIGNILFWRMVEQVNSKLLNEERFDFFWLTPGKITRLETQHKRFFPDSRLRLYANLAFLTFFASFGFLAYLLNRTH